MLSSATLTVTGNTTLQGSLTQSIGGTTKFNVDTSGNTSIGGTLTTTGNTTHNGTLTTTGHTTLNGTLTTVGNTVLNGSLT